MTDPAAVLGGDPGRPVSASKIPFPAAVVEREVRARLMPYSGCRAAVICELARAMSDAVARRSELRLQVRPKSLVAHRRPSDGVFRKKARPGKAPTSAGIERISSFWTAVRSLLPLPVALKASPAARQLSLPPLPIQPRDRDRA